MFIYLVLKTQLYQPTNHPVVWIIYMNLTLTNQCCEEEKEFHPGEALTQAHLTNVNHHHDYVIISVIKIMIPMHQKRVKNHRL